MVRERHQERDHAREVRSQDALGVGERPLARELRAEVAIGNERRIDAAELARRIGAGGGSASLKTVQGGTLTARMRGNDVVIVDAKGGTSVVTTANVYQSNGVIHVVDTVLMP